MFLHCVLFYFFFFNDPATTEIYTLSYTTLFRSHGAEFSGESDDRYGKVGRPHWEDQNADAGGVGETRSEEHTSELQSLRHLVCRLLLEKKKKKKKKEQKKKYTEKKDKT